MIGVIREDISIPLSLKNNFLFRLTNAITVFIRFHLRDLYRLLLKIHHPYHLLRLRNHKKVSDFLRSVSLLLLYLQL